MSDARDKLFVPAGIGPQPPLRAEEESTNEPTMRQGRQDAYAKALPVPPSGWDVKSQTGITQIHHNGEVHNAR